ncbi:hypothetical protein GCM10023080_026620 [Streptomyces pseudoechinosporeus]
MKNRVRTRTVVATTLALAVVGTLTAGMSYATADTPVAATAHKPVTRSTDGWKAQQQAANVKIAGEYFQAIQKGDFDKVGRILDKNVVWHQPGFNQFSGTHKGRDAVFKMLGGMTEASQGTFAIDKVNGLMPNGDKVAAPIHFSGKRDDRSMSMDGVDVLRFKHGKVVEVWLYSGDQAAEDAFWGR